MQHNSRSRPPTGSMLQKAMQGRMVLRPHVQGPHGNDQGIESSTGNKHLKPPGPRLSFPRALTEEKQKREQQPAGDSGERMNQKYDAVTRKEHGPDRDGRHLPPQEQDY